MMKRYSLLLALSLIGSSALAQAPLSHQAKAYTDSAGNYFQKATLPVYLYISTSAGEKDMNKLESVNQKKGEPMYLDGHGKHFIRHEDVIENHVVTFEINADGIAPVSSFVPKDKAYKRNNVRYYSPQSRFEIEAKDEMSGISEVLYSINKGSFQTYSKPMMIEEEGDYRLAYYAVDNVGNVENVETSFFTIDGTAPLTAMKVIGEQYEQYVSRDFTIALHSQDQLSGVESIHYQIDKQAEQVYQKDIKMTGLEPGTHFLKYYAYDKVKNKEEVRSYRFSLDVQAPEMSHEVIGEEFEANNNTYFAKDTKIVLKAEDDQSGVKDIYYSFDAQEYKLYEEPVLLNILDNKKVELYAYAIDKVNNVSLKRDNGQKEQPLVVGTMDLSGPKLGYSFNGPSFEARDSIFVSGQTQINLVGKDNQSGLYVMTYQINGGPEADYTQPIQLDANGIYNFKLKGFDNLLNDSEMEFTVVNDTEGPDIFPRMSVDPSARSRGSQAVYPDHAILFLAATDHQAGLEQIFYSVNGQPEQAYQGMIRDFEQGTTYEVVVRAVDKLGNESKETVRFSIESPHKAASTKLH